MPITADLGGKQYTLGRGRVMLDRYPANIVMTALTRGIGERYIGNTPEFSTNSSSENLDHYDSDAGVRTKDDSVELSFDRAGSFTCDNIDSDNIALYFLGDKATVTQAAATGVVDVLTVKQKMFYQLGMTALLPAGVRNVGSVVVKKGSPGFATTVSAAGNYQVDEVLGRIYIEAGAPDITDDTIIQVTFNVLASTRGQVISKNQSIYAAVRFVADNPKGVNRDYYFPYVKLSPDGDYNLKGEEWQTMGFTMEILKKASNVESVYIDERPVLTP